MSLSVLKADAQHKVRTLGHLVLRGAGTGFHLGLHLNPVTDVTSLSDTAGWSSQTVWTCDSECLLEGQMPSVTGMSLGRALVASRAACLECRKLIPLGCIQC